MGLFIGASILTILELLDYLYEVVKVSLMHDCTVESILRIRSHVVSCDCVFCTSVYSNVYNHHI